MSNTSAIARAIEIKNRLVIIKTCPVIDLDGTKWYDTTDYGFTQEKLFLSMVGVLIYHPVNCALVRFKEAKVDNTPPPVSDPRRVLRPFRHRERS